METLPKVLIVEDDPAIRALLVAALKREPLDVHMAADGLEALERVRANDYAVILLDLMMPRVSGYEFLAAFEQVQSNTLEPVVFVMTAFDTAMVHRISGGTVHAIITKPFNVEQVVEMVRDCANVHHEHVTRHTATATESRPLVPPPLDDDTSGQLVC